MLQFLAFLILLQFAYIFAMCLLSILMTYKEWKYYSKIYKELPNKTWIKEYFGMKGTQNNESEFYWYTQSNNFMLHESKFIYLVNNPLYYNPYSLYYLFKFRKWCKQNLKNKIQSQN